MLRRRASAAALVWCALGGLACSTPAVDDVADASSALTQGLVVVEREASPDAEAQASVSAKFMRLGSGVDAEVAERVVGARLELPAVGTCMALPASDEVPPLAGHASIELLDVGDVAVTPGSSARLPLATRAFPEVGDVVSGVFYTSREGAELADGSYQISVSGSAHLDGFTVTADAPVPLEDVWLGDDALAEGPAVEEGRPVQVRWQPATDARAEDRVVFDVVAASGAVVRCSFADEGSATLPGTAFAERALGALPATPSIEVHRVRRAFFGNGSIDAGEIRFDLAMLGRVTVAAAGPAVASDAAALPAD